MATSSEDVLDAPRAAPRKERPGRELAAEPFQAFAAPIVWALAWLRVPAPAVVLAHAGVGLAAAYAVAVGSLVAAALLLQLKTLLDGVDGQLARASGQVTTLGRFLDTEADFLVNACLFGALAVLTAEPVLAVVAFCSVTAVLSVDHNLALVYEEACGRQPTLPAPARSALERALARVYDAVFGWQDRLVRGLSERRLARLVGEEPDPGRRRAVLAYHDRTSATVVANLGLSTQLLVLGLCLLAGAQVVYLWLAAACVLVLPFVQLRREARARRALLR